MQIDIKRYVFDFFRLIIVFVLVLICCLAIITNLALFLSIPLQSHISFVVYATIPYLVFALLIKKDNVFYSRFNWFSLAIICTVFEKLMWLYFGYLVYLGSPDGKRINEDLMIFIQREILPFYSYNYIIYGSIVSVTIVVLMLEIRKR